jgi:hypothetical protein
VRDTDALAAACGRLGLEPPARGVAQLFNAQAEGQIVRLPGWRFPVVFDVAAGTAHYDHFGGHWGDPKQFDRLLQAYAVEKAKAELRRQGHVCTEQPLLEGSIKLLVRPGVAIGGGAL